MSELPDRRAVEQALRAAGLSHRQARKFIAAGWSVLVGQIEAERLDLAERLAELQSQLRPNGE